MPAKHRDERRPRSESGPLWFVLPSAPVHSWQPLKYHILCYSQGRRCQVGRPCLTPSDRSRRGWLQRIGGQVGGPYVHRNAAISSSSATIWPPRVEDGTRMTVRTPIARHASTPSRTSLALPNSVTSVSHRSDMVAMSSRV